MIYTQKKFLMFWIATACALLYAAHAISVTTTEEDPQATEKGTLTAPLSGATEIPEFLRKDPTGYEALLEKVEEFFKSAPKTPPFYNVRKDKTSFHILGTCHALPLSVLPDEIQQIIKASTVLLTERGDPPSEEDAEKVTETVQNMFDSECAQTFSTTFSPEQLSYINNFPFPLPFVLAEGTTREQVIPSLKPEILLDLINSTHMKNAMDIQLEEQFQEKEWIALETIEESDVRHNDRPREQAISTMKEIIDRSLSAGTGYMGSPSIVEMCLNYMRNITNNDGDVPVSESDPYFDSKMEEDNLKWAPRIREKASSLGTKDEMLVAIGDDHLWGKTGILRDLIENGYSVTDMTGKALSREDTRED